MQDSSFLWFENTVKDGSAILNAFRYHPHRSRFVSRTVLSIIKNVGAIKHSKNDFRILAKDAAFLAAAIYRLKALDPPQREQLSEQIEDMVMTLQSIEVFIGSCVLRHGIRHWAISGQADRKVIKQHRRKVADTIAGFEFYLLTQPTPARINDDSTYHPAEEPFPTQHMDGGINPRLRRHDVHHPGYAYPDAFSLPTPTTIVYDYSYHTTDHGWNNYQGQNMYQGSSSHGVHPPNFLVRHFNNNEFHCWTPSGSCYPTGYQTPIPDDRKNGSNVECDDSSSMKSMSQVDDGMYAGQQSHFNESIPDDGEESHGAL